MEVRKLDVINIAGICQSSLIKWHRSAALMLTIAQPLKASPLRRDMLPERESSVTSRRYITEVA